MSDRYGVPQELTLDLLGQAENALNSLIARGADTAMLRRRKAMMLISFAYSYKLLGRYDDAMRRVADAHDLLVSLTTRDPGNIEWQNELAIAEYKTGDINLYWGHLVEALEKLRASAQLFKKYPEKRASSALVLRGRGKRVVLPVLDDNPARRNTIHRWRQRCGFGQRRNWPRPCRTGGFAEFERPDRQARPGIIAY